MHANWKPNNLCTLKQRLFDAYNRGMARSIVVCAAAWLLAALAHGQTAGIDAQRAQNQIRIACDRTYVLDYTGFLGSSRHAEMRVHAEQQGDEKNLTIVEESVRIYSAPRCSTNCLTASARPPNRGLTREAGWLDQTIPSSWKVSRHHNLMLCMCLMSHQDQRASLPGRGAYGLIRLITL